MRVATRNFLALLAGLAMMIATVEGPIAATRGPTTLTAVRYDLTLDGHLIGSFAELVVVTSIAAPPGPSTTTVASVTIPSGNTQTAMLRRPMTLNIEIAAWHELVKLGDLEAARKSVSLTAYGADGRPVARYHLTNAYPEKLEVTALRAGASDVLMETVTLTCEFIQRVSV